jgi:hypothetical protein
VAFNARMKKLEAGLETRKRVFAWLEQSKATGGFRKYWRQRLMGPLVPHAWLADSEAFFLYVLVNEVNLYVLQNVPATLDFWFATKAIFRVMSFQMSLPAGLGLLQYWQSRLGSLLEEALVLEAATEAISETHFDDHQVLFPDALNELHAEVNSLCELAENYNGIAVALDVDPINIHEPAGYQAKVEAKVAEFTRRARAEVLAQDGDLTAAVRLLLLAPAQQEQSGPKD